MKLLLEGNLSPRLVEWLRDVYPEMKHVQMLGLGSAEDAVVWDYARENGFAILSKDSDFAERSFLEKDPPKIVWVWTGNCSVSDAERTLRLARTVLESFLEGEVQTCLILGRG
jgi:predicted nuclease of predicted toxin-antitoxin system